MIECKRCHKDTEVSQERYDSLIRRKKLPLCHDCKSEIVKETLAKQTPEERAARYNKASQSHKDNWASLTEEERNARAKAAQEGIHNMSNEKKALRSKHSSEATRKIMANLTDAQRAERSQKLSEANYRRYANMSDEERKELGKLISIGQLSMSEEKRLEANRKRSESMKGYIRSLSDEELSERIKNSTNFRWDNMTKEKFQEQKFEAAMLHNEQAKRYPTIGIAMLTKQEYETYTLLKSLSVTQVIPQWYSLQKYPDFDKLFPINPVTNSEFVNPYHKWDFKITLKFEPNVDILIDIDGTSHTSTKDSHAFRDGLRPYQTDGLESYIIKCTYGNLKDETSVVHVNTGKEMTLKDLIKRINNIPDNYKPKYSKF